MKIAEIRNLSDSELQAKKKDARLEYFNLRMQQQSGQLEKPSRLADLKLSVAKCETVISERRLGLKITSRKPKAAAAKK
jgi:large subunit ribosomal protein L29